MWFRQVVGVLYPGFIVPFCFFPSPKKVSRACTWCACCKIFGDDEEEGWPGEHVYFLQDVFLVSFFSFFFICLRHSVICIVGQLELDRAFHRREFVSFLYAQRRAWRGCGSAASYLSHHTHCLFFSCFVEGRWWLGGGGGRGFKSSNQFNFYLLAICWDGEFLCTSLLYYTFFLSWLVWIMDCRYFCGLLFSYTRCVGCMSCLFTTSHSRCFNGLDDEKNLPLLFLYTLMIMITSFLCYSQ